MVRVSGLRAHVNKFEHVSHNLAFLRVFRVSTNELSSLLLKKSN